MKKYLQAMQWASAQFMSLTKKSLRCLLVEVPWQIL